MIAAHTGGLYGIDDILTIPTASTKGGKKIKVKKYLGKPTLLGSPSTSTNKDRQRKKRERQNRKRGRR